MNIEIKNIKKSYGKNKVLSDITFSAKSGECIGILGENGCGKSTLLSILAGIEKCDHGAFCKDGADLLPNKKLLQSCVGYVPQGTPLIEELTAKDNLLLWYSKKDLEKELESGVLKMLGIDKFLKTTVSKMSGGMKKRLSIGCAVSNDPDILLLDEPCAALDLICKENIISYIKDLKENGGIVILTTHDSMDIQVCDRLLILKNGSLSPYEYNGSIPDLVKNL